MSWGNKYYEFDEAIRWFRAIGHSASNTYIGSSRAIDTVYEPTTINPGDQVHALLGGTFVVRADGTVEEGKFKLPKHLFEKSYGIRQSDADLCDLMAKAGRCREIEKPAAKADYNAPRKAYDANKLPDLMGNVPRGRKWPNSPTLDFIIRNYAEASLDESLNARGAVAEPHDVGHQPDSLEASLVIRFEDKSRIAITASPLYRQIWVRDDYEAFGRALSGVDFASLGLAPEFRNSMVTIFKEDEAPAMMKVLGEFIEHGHINAPSAPKP